MRITLIQLSSFISKWSKLKLTDEDLQSLESVLIDDPQAGPVIPGTGGLRKLRFAPPTWHRGKRGAARIIYAFIAAGEAIYLFTLYTKQEQSELSQNERRIFRQVLKRLHERYRL